MISTPSWSEPGSSSFAMLRMQGSAGPPRESVAWCHQVTTLDREKLHQHVGTLPSVAVAAVADGLKATMALD
jgi:mRNA-degrading endonuclease toxin of MazEF toxin-antitoxin module